MRDKLAGMTAAQPPLRLHIGCGSNILPAWLNIDSKPAPGVDRVLDVRAGLPFDDVATIFAEHFIEHLTLDEATAFLRDCRRALREDGILRLTTPNLDWVWLTSYASRWRPVSATTATIDAHEWLDSEEAAADCLRINRAFRGWGHRFLWNRAMLEIALRAAGFGSVTWCAYGESDHAELRRLERHRVYADTAALPHLLVVEASGCSKRSAPDSLRQFLDEYQRDVGVT